MRRRHQVKRKSILEKWGIKTHGSHMSRSLAPVAQLPPMANAYVEVLIAAKGLTKNVAHSHFTGRRL